MFWVLTTGLSWPGSLSEGRFNIFHLPADEKAIAIHLEHGFKVDDRERSCVSMWADDGFANPPSLGGIRVWVFEASDTFAADIDKSDEKYWAQVASKPPVYCVDIHDRSKICDEAKRLARALPEFWMIDEPASHLLDDKCRNRGFVCI